VRAVAVLRDHPRVDEALPAELDAPLRRSTRVSARTSAAEGPGIFVAVSVVMDLGHPRRQAPAATAVVALHFLPLAFAFASGRPPILSAAAPWPCGPCPTRGRCAPVARRADQNRK